MFCIHCGAENVNGARFCVSCGKNVQSSRPGKVHAPASPGETELGLIEGQLLSERFMIRKLLGAGGMGRVYLAHDRVLDLPVAIKVLRDVLSHDTGSIRRLVQEARASIRLAHPNIVRIDDYHDAGSVKFLAMEYVEGMTLADRIAQEVKLTEKETRAIAIAICRGLEHAHQNKVIHRDLKPGNILLGKNGSIKIADFGIARVARDSISRLTSQQDSGTLLYMSPEQLMGKSSEASDLYSLGVVLYEMLTGDPPFHSGDVTYQIREVPPPLPGGISADFAAIIMKCLEKRVEDRFTCAAELRRVLENPGLALKHAAAVPQNPISAPASSAPPLRAETKAPRLPVMQRADAGSPQQTARPGRASTNIKYSLLGAIGFGGISLLGLSFIYGGGRGEIQTALFIIFALTGFLGPSLLSLKGKVILRFAIVFTVIGLLMALSAFELYGRSDLEDVAPLVVMLLFVGGAIYGHRVGNRLGS